MYSDELDGSCLKIPPGETHVDTRIKKDCRTGKGTFGLCRFYKSEFKPRRVKNYLQVLHVLHLLSHLLQLLHLLQQPLKTPMQTTTATTARILRILTSPPNFLFLSFKGGSNEPFLPLSRYYFINRRDESTSASKIWSLERLKELLAGAASRLGFAGGALVAAVALVTATAQNTHADDDGNDGENLAH
ncbi:MAG: hypothetical protein WCT04_06015 [Planctomycetota bacterium]